MTVHVLAQIQLVSQKPPAIQNPVYLLAIMGMFGSRLAWQHLVGLIYGSHGMAIIGPHSCILRTLLIESTSNAMEMFIQRIMPWRFDLAAKTPWQ